MARNKNTIVEPHEIAQWTDELITLQGECANTGRCWRTVMHLAHMGDAEDIFTILGRDIGSRVLSALRNIRNSITADVNRIPTIIASGTKFDGSQFNDTNEIDWCYIVMGPNCWGRATSIERAKRKAQASKPTYIKRARYEYYRVTADATVSEMGCVDALQVIKVSGRDEPVACPEGCGNEKQYADDEACGWCMDKMREEQSR